MKVKLISHVIAGGDEAPSTLHQAKADVLTNVQCSDEMPYQIRLTHVCVGGEGQAISCDVSIIYVADEDRP